LSVWRWTAACCPERHLHGAQCLGVETRGAGPEDAGEILAARVIDLMRATAMPNGLTALGYGERDIPALIEGTLKQPRLLSGAPRAVGAAEIGAILHDSLRCW